MKVIMDNMLHFKTDDLDERMLIKLRKRFRQKNPDYEDDKTQSEYIKMYIEKNNRMYVPRGVQTELLDILPEGTELVDKRLELEEIEFNLRKDFVPYRHQRVSARLAKILTQGTIESPCGSGKTVILLYLITLCKQPAIILVPDTTLQKQWISNAKYLLGLKDKEIGLIGDGNYDYKEKKLTVAPVQSIYSHLDDRELFRSFGFVGGDEIHFYAAKTFRTSINLFYAKYRFGVTATLFRTDNLGCFIEDYCGKKLYTVTDEMLEKEGLLLKPELVKRPTTFKFRVDYRYRNWYMTMTKYMSANSVRNKFICNDIIKNSYKEKRMALVVSTTVNHCAMLAKILLKKEPKIRIGFLTEIRDKTLYNVETIDVEEKAKQGKIDVVMGVQKVRQGLDIPPLEDVYLVMPRKSAIDITQIVGRVMRPSDCFGKYENKMDKVARVYDYIDVNIPVLEKQFKESRLPIYEKRCKVKSAKRRVRHE